MEDSIDRFRPPAPARGVAVPALLFLVLIVGVWADPLLSHRSFAGRDLIAYNLPMEKSIHDAYAAGEFPIWSPYISGGRPLLPNPNAGAMYPVRMLLAPLRFPVAAKVFTVLHWAVGGIGMIVLLTSLGASRRAAWIAAVTYAFSGVVVSDYYFLHVLPGMALLPFIVWAARRSGSTAGRIFLLSFLFALDFLAGDVFTIGIAMLCAAAWILLEPAASDRRRRLWELSGSLALAALAALPQIVATAMWIPETNRAVMGIKWREALQFSVSPFRLLELVVPYPFGQNYFIDDKFLWGWKVFNHKMMGLFLTFYAGALAVIALVALWKSRAPAARLGRWIVIGAIALSVPGSLIPEAWENAASPLPLRNPEKFALALAFGLAILAGLAFDELRRRARLPRWIYFAGVALGGAAILAAAFPASAGRVALFLTRTPDQFLSGAARELPYALAEGALLWLFTWLALEAARSGARAVTAAGLAMLTAVPILATQRIPWTFVEEDVFAPPPYVRHLRREDPEGRFRTLGQLIYRDPGEVEKATAGRDPAYIQFARNNWTQHSQVLWERGTVFNGDFDNGDLSRIESARKVSAIAGGYRDGGPFFENLSLRFGIRYRDQPPLPGFSREGGTSVDDWDVNPDALPDIRLADGWIEVPGAVEALATISKLPRGHVVIETGRSGAGSAPGVGAVKILEERPARLVMETSSTRPTLLFVLRGFWQHRTVLVDGEEAEVFPAQLAFSAVRVPAGRHRVEWVERFPGWEVSRAGPLLYVLLVALLFARQRGARTPRPA